MAAEDITAGNRVAYALARVMYGDGPLDLREVFTAIDTLHPGVRPPFRRYLSPARAPHVARYVHERSRWALDLFGTQERLDGVRQMCDDIVAAYDAGTMSFYELRGRKPV